MPPDHLTAIPPQRVAAGVLSVLAGADPATIAAECRMEMADLRDAVELYRAAGAAALEHQAERDWYQVRVQFPDWNAAETAAATRLAPHLDRLQTSGAISGAWFLRKHPCWRLRLRRADVEAVDDLLDELVAGGVLTRWWPTVYEPETAAFGGPAGMSPVDELFEADSRGVLRYVRRSTPGIGRRELSILLINALFEAAGLDRFERGDVFAKVADLRPVHPDTDATRIGALAMSVRRGLLTVPATPDGPLFGSGAPVAYAAPWLTAFQRAGCQLGQAAARGELGRGLRVILSHVLIFHWNRLGLSATTQGVLARAATEALLPER